MTLAQAAPTRTGLPARVPVAVVGGGQAGLSLSWHLVQRGIEHVVLERDTIAHEWADARWDSFCLVTPNWQCQLPGWPYTGEDPDGFMVRDEIVEYVRSYAASFDPPVHEGVAVTKLAPAPDGGYLLTTSAGDVAADQVVLAVGGYHLPVLPPWAGQLPERVTQLHSQAYRNPGQLPAGDVLVVGTGQSGAQIAEDLHLAGHRVHLAVGSAPRIARRYRGRDMVEWLHDMSHYDMPVEQHRDGEAARMGTNHYVTGRDGGRDIDLRRFATEGMQLYGTLTGLDGGVLSFAPNLTRHLDAADRVDDNAKNLVDAHIERSGIDAPTEPRYTPVWAPDADPTSLDVDAISSVVWAIGFRADWSWVRVPVFDGAGYPTHVRGVTSAPGLYVLGLPWLHTWGSGRFAGIARDAEFLADRITDLTGTPTGLTRSLAVAAASSAARMA
ncbi:MSMEG_0569 family flavin-dependent oxidoreductase [Modestobacter muralis]|uniref:MSMEG_0569 family flavin-dependent oxidoreductase n=1 Tax=Modestobacter muralis TaxID=1608614 RepID=A0A6P0EPC9_9ACTN|nr:MSMEG_0569 family flavin-dependent oxidoreductase [Modestobacter muralis]NEK93581.1 MSMEG_0569 family flavin-dependent oxidoreductase [Modestobacter muralis]NEN50348.1 MSMEG_0569 family flavin-dependent oxidoreductase [Modestobacter muralis]